jgi:hypothetical protein
LDSESIRRLKIKNMKQRKKKGRKKIKTMKRKKEKSIIINTIP